MLSYNDIENLEESLDIRGRSLQRNAFADIYQVATRLVVVLSTTNKDLAREA